MENLVLHHTKGSLGIIELNRPQALNALNFEMLSGIKKALLEFEIKPEVLAVFLHSSTQKAFCAGGDVKGLAQGLLAGESINAALEYFKHEYHTDYMIHTYSKPIVCWGDSWIMGGGWGLFAGSSHKVVTEITKLSMPETAIGFFPDVAASWFFKELDPKLAIFLGMTGARVDASTALDLKLADYLIESSKKTKLIADLSVLKEEDLEETLDLLLKKHSHAPEKPEITKTDWVKLDRKMEPNDPLKTHQNLLSWKPENHSWRGATDSYKQFSPYCALFTHAMFTTAQRLPSLHRAFDRDLQVAQYLCQRADFVEGVSAKLIEKRPARWQPSEIDVFDAETELRRAYDPEKSVFV